MVTITLNPPEIAIIIYGMLIFLGGLIGYLKANSKASLIAGTLSAIFTFVACVVAVQYDELIGLAIGCGIAGLLTINFGIKAFKSNNFMPIGVFFFLSLVTVIYIAWAIQQLSDDSGTFMNRSKEL